MDLTQNMDDSVDQKMVKIGINKSDKTLRNEQNKSQASFIHGTPDSRMTTHNRNKAAQQSGALVRVCNLFVRGS